MKATQEMYDAAYKAFDCGSDTIAAAVDAALGLVPVVEVTPELAEKARVAYLHATEDEPMLAALQATFPASFVVGGETQGTRLNLVEERNDWRANAEQALARAEAAEKRVAELEARRVHVEAETARICGDRDTARAELAALREGVEREAATLTKEAVDRARFDNGLDRAIGPSDDKHGIADRLRALLAAGAPTSEVAMANVLETTTEEDSLIAGAIAQALEEDDGAIGWAATPDRALRAWEAGVEALRKVRGESLARKWRLSAEAQELRDECMRKTHEALAWRNEALAATEQKTRAEKAQAEVERLYDVSVAAVNEEIRKALYLVSKAFPGMDRFTNLVPTVQWLLERDREWVQRVVRLERERDTARTALADAAALGVTLSDAPVSVPEGYQYASAADALRPGDRHGLVASANPSEIPNSSDLAGAVRHIARYCAWNRKAARDEALALLGVPASAPAADAATTGERPKVGEVVSWERAKADMVAHPEARYGDSPHDPRPYRVHGGRLQWWQHDQWCDENTPDQGDQVRLLDAGAAPASDGLAKRVSRLEAAVQELCNETYSDWQRCSAALAKLSAGGGQ